MKKIIQFFRMAASLPTITTRRSKTKYRELLVAMKTVESGGEAFPTYAVGDEGRSIGPYQISYGYWLDATRQTFELKQGTWAMCVFDEYAEKVILAYWLKYAPPSASWEQLARIHNGGPNGHGRRETAKYWREVSKHLFKR